MESNAAEVKWEEVEGTGNTFRAKVPGGWLIKESSYGTLGLCFMPDPEHHWGKEEISEEAKTES